MLTGRFIHRILPQLQTGSHYTVNRLANRLVSRHIDVDFPDWKHINNYEGWNGIDGLWIQNRHETSRSTYNPLNQEGQGLLEVERQFDGLITAWAENDTEGKARQLAYVSHVITDLCTPPHQHGRYVPAQNRRWYAFWMNDDWEESVLQKNSHDSHFKFEMSLLYKLLWKPLRKGRLHRRMVKRFFRNKERPRTLLQGYLRRLTLQIRNLNLFQEFMERGWTRRVDRSMRFIVLPNIVSTVATTWYLGAVEGEMKRLGLPNFARTSYYPLIGRKRRQTHRASGMQFLG